MPTNYIVWQTGLIPNFGQAKSNFEDLEEQLVLLYSTSFCTMCGANYY